MTFNTLNTNPDSAHAINALLSQIPSAAAADYLRQAACVVDDSELSDALNNLSSQPDQALDAMMRGAAMFLSYVPLPLVNSKLSRAKTLERTINYAI